MTTIPTSDELKAQLINLKEIPTLPHVFQEILALMVDDSKGANDLAERISLDQSLTAKVLKIANSAYYGFFRNVSSVRDAVVILGYEEIKGLVLAISVFDLFDGPDQSLIDRMVFWEHTLEVATTAEILAKTLPDPCSDAFVGGLLHDIGKVVLDSCFHSYWKKITQVMESDLMLSTTAEESVLGEEVHHCTIGYWISEIWNLPQEISQAIKLHHSQDEDILKSQPLALLIQAADCLVYEKSPDVYRNFIPPTLSPQAEKFFNLTENKKEELFNKVDKKMETRRGLLGHIEE